MHWMQHHAIWILMKIPLKEQDVSGFRDCCR